MAHSQAALGKLAGTRTAQCVTVGDVGLLEPMRRDCQCAGGTAGDVGTMRRLCRVAFLERW